MKRWMLVVWLVMPLVVVGGLALTVDRSRGRPHPAPGLPSLAAVTGAVAQPVEMVEPESLEQGFVIIVEDKPKTANAASPIFMASSHNGWNPGDQAMKLSAASDGRWKIVWEKPKLDSRISFKFTRGSWESVEVSPDFTDIDNRMLPKIEKSKIKAGEKPVIELAVEKWRDARPNEPGLAASNPYREIKVGAGSIKRVEVVGGGVPGLVRDVLVWLPPGYEKDSTRTYPVLYLMDGQNVFEKLPSVPGEWGADETAAKLIEAGTIEPMIIVGIPHAGAERTSEYTPIDVYDKAPARGKAFGAFVVNEVMPRVERAFRVRPGSASTWIGGSSLGAVISLYIATEYPDRFGGVIAESPALMAKNKALMTFFAERSNWPRKVYIGMGGRENGTEAKDGEANKATENSARELAKHLMNKGVTEDRLKLVIDEEAIHQEGAWAKRFGGVLEFLGGKGK